MLRYVFGFRRQNPYSPSKSLNAKSAHKLNRKKFKPNIPLRFVYLGDSRGAPGMINVKLLVQVLEDVKRHKPDFIVFGGDMARYGSYRNFEEFKNIVHKIVPTIPFFVLPGNHEYYGDVSLTKFRESIGIPNFIIEIPTHNFRLYGLNNILKVLPETELYGFDPVHNKYAKTGYNKLLNVSLKELNETVVTKKKKHGFKNTVFAVHVAPRFEKWANAFIQPHGIHAKYALFTYGRSGFLKITNKYGKYVPGSHIHVMTTTQGIVKKGNTTYFVSGKAGAPLEKGWLKPYMNPPTKGTQNVFRELANYALFTVTPNTIKHTIYADFSNGRFKPT